MPSKPIQLRRSIPVTFKQARVLMALESERQSARLRPALKKLEALATEIEAEREARCGVSALARPGGTCRFAPLGSRRPADPASGLH